MIRSLRKRKRLATESRDAPGGTSSGRRVSLWDSMNERLISLPLIILMMTPNSTKSSHVAGKPQLVVKSED